MTSAKNYDATEEALLLLKSFLEKLDDTSASFIRLDCIDNLLKMNAKFQLPVWLLPKSQPLDVIRIYLRHNRLHDASSLFLLVND